MMPAPVPQFWKGDNSAILTSWDAGIVDADSYSEEIEVLVWNNRGSPGNPTSDVSDMTNVFITTKNIDGTDTGPVATKEHAIVEVKTYDGSEWSDWQEIGGSSSTVQLISASGIPGVISGAGNEGDAGVNLANYARIRLRLHVLPTAPAGQISWKTRVSYQYI